MLFPAVLAPAACYSFSTPTRPQRQLLHQHPPLLIPAALEMKGGGWQNAVIGPVLQCLEAATLGMPLEVRMRALSPTR